MGSIAVRIGGRTAETDAKTAAISAEQPQTVRISLATEVQAIRAPFGCHSSRVFRRRSLRA
jgi:hypothetical protein